MAALAVSTLGCAQRDSERTPAAAARPVAIQKPADSTGPAEGEATFIGTVRSIDLLPKRDPYFRFAVNLKIDRVVSGPSPGNGFWFAIHSPSQSRVKEGQRYRITANKSVDGWTIISRTRLD